MVVDKKKLSELKEKTNTIDDCVEKLRCLSIELSDTDLTNIFCKLIKGSKELSKYTLKQNNKNKYLIMSDKPLDVKLVECNIEYSLYTSLKRAGLVTLGDVLDRGVEGLLRIRNIGDVSIIKLKEVCKTYGLELL